MDKATSLYLDCCRFGAALMVFMFHLLSQPFYSGELSFPFGRQPVIIFFVISGYVIAYVSDRKERTVRDYALSRLARLYSVVIPALVLAWCLDMAVFRMAPAMLDDNAHSWPLVRFLVSLLFLNQSWNLTVMAFSNGPYWSLCYEFWYYVIFGAFVFAPGRLRLPLVAFGALMAGPRIMLLFPLWLLEVAAYHMRKPIVALLGGRTIFLVSLAWFLAQLFGEFNPLDDAARAVGAGLDEGYWMITPSLRVFIGGDYHFLADYALGLAFATTVATCGSALIVPAGPRRFEKALRFSSS